MATCFLDTNVCVGYLDSNDTYHQVSVDIINQLATSKHALAISPLVLDELIHTLSRNLRIVGQLSSAQSLVLIKQSVTQFLNLPNLMIINPPNDIPNQIKIFTLMQKFRLKPRDAYHLLTIKHHHIKFFATLDQDFATVFAKTSLCQFLPQT